MKKIFTAMLMIVACSLLVACVRDMTAAEDAVQKDVVSVALKEPVTSVMEPEDETGTDETPAEEELEETEMLTMEDVFVEMTGEYAPAEKSAAAEKSAFEEAFTVVEVEVSDTVAPEQYSETSECAEEEYNISEEELQAVWAAFEAWKHEQENPSTTYHGGSEMGNDVPKPAMPGQSLIGVPDPVTGLIARSEEDVLAFINDFLDNYHNSESFRSLDEEGLTYLDDCINLLRTDPYSDEDIVRYMKKYQSGFYDDEMFAYNLECWIEFAGPFGEGCTIYVM